MAPGLTCPVSREVTDPGRTGARRQSEGEQAGALVQVSPCPHMDTASRTLSPHHPVLMQLNPDHVCKARGKQDPP